MEGLEELHLTSGYLAAAVDKGRDAADGSADADGNAAATEAAATTLGDFLSKPSRFVGMLSPGCYFAWVFLVYFTPIMFGEGGGFSALYETQLAASLLGYFAVLIYRIVGRGFHVPISAVRVIVWSSVATAATACIMVVRLISGEENLLPLVAVASLVAGAAFALVHVYWIAQYSQRRAGDVPYTVGGFFFLSCAITLVAVLLPREAAFVVMSLLPLAAGVSVNYAAERDDSLHSEAGYIKPSEEHWYRLPGGMLLGIVAMGLVYGLAQDFSLVYQQTASLIAIDCIVANGVVGVFVVLYANFAAKNFGHSTLCLIIVPVAGLAQGMIAVFRTDLLPISFFVMRLAYVFFDAMLWLQLPRAFERVKSIRVFLVVRLAFEGSMFLGIVAHKALMLLDFTVFEVVSLACLGLLLAALTVAFATDSIGTVWNLVPTRISYTGKFRRACRSIEEEYSLTKRESEVLELVLRGRSGPYIEEKLFISKNTFQTHMRNVYNKMDIHSQQDLLDLLEQRMDEHRAQGL